MKNSIFVKLQKLQKRYEEIELMLSQSDIFSNQNQYSILSQEYLKLSDIIQHFIAWKKIQKNINDITLLLNDHEMRFLVEEELELEYKNLHVLEKKLKLLLLPIDPHDERSCFIEIHAATGGDEAAIFAGDLFRMYARYSEYRNWKVKLIRANSSEKGGFKEIIAEVTGLGSCGRLKFESGGHRVQRVPQTEAQGRIHTSTCTVAVMPILLECEKTVINVKDLKIDTFRSSGAGGQHVNTTDSAIRITHIPTGNVVECQDERSQHKNKAKALSVLTARIHASEILKRNAKNALLRRDLLGSGDRSDRSRTYNFPQNRITDHRINLTLYCLDEILNGKLDCIIEPIMQEYQADLLSGLSNE